MMKFQKKLVLDNTTLSDTAFFRSSHTAYIDARLTGYLYYLERLACRLGHYLLLLRKKSPLIKHRLRYFRKQITSGGLTSDKTPRTTHWPLLIKATTAHSVAVEDPITSRSKLSGRSVLCVGGRMALYPGYGQLIASFSGNFLSFRGDSNDHLDNLRQLLNIADIVICPVDCVNHEAFFVAKQYCQHSGKPCVMLDRSALNTFRKGIDILAHMAAEKPTTHSLIGKK